MKSGGLVALFLSLTLGLALFLTVARGGTCWFTARDDGDLQPGSFEERFGKMQGIPREDLPPDLASVLRPGDHVGVTIVTCWRFPWLSRLDRKYTYYTVYEPCRGDIPLGRFTDGRLRFLSLLGLAAILPVLTWLVGFALLRALSRCAKETPSP